MGEAKIKKRHRTIATAALLGVRFEKFGTRDENTSYLVVLPSGEYLYKCITFSLADGARHALQHLKVKL